MWPNPQETSGLVISTEEILNGKLHFLYSVNYFGWASHLIAFGLGSNFFPFVSDAYYITVEFLQFLINSW